MFDEEGRTDWTILDAGAATELTSVLVAAARDLAAMGRQPAVIAACPNKHDDTGRYPSWLGLQLGNTWWECADYRLEGSQLVEEDGQSAIDAQVLRPILDRLQSTKWRAMVERVFNFKLRSESLVVAVQHDAAWFLISASNEGEDAAFVLEPAGSLLYVGAAERFDQCLGKAYPVILQYVDDASWPLLRKAVPHFPLMAPLASLKDEATIAAHNKLVSLLSSAITELSAVPSELKYLEGANRDPNYPLPRQQWLSVALNNSHVSQQGWTSPGRFRESIQKQGNELMAILRILEDLEAAGWRDLFSMAIMPLADDESVALLERDGHTYVIARRTTLFEVTPSGLVLAGACDYLSSAGFAGRVRLHML